MIPYLVMIPYLRNQVQIYIKNIAMYINYIAKILTKILQHRTDDNLGNNQYGNQEMKKCGMWEAVLRLRLIHTLKKPLHSEFINLEKAFDSIYWEKPF